MSQKINTQSRGSDNRQWIVEKNRGLKRLKLVGHLHYITRNQFHRFIYKSTALIQQNSSVQTFLVIQKGIIIGMAREEYNVDYQGYMGQGMKTSISSV